MRKELIKTKLDKLESAVGIKEPIIFVTSKGYDPERRYTFEIVDGKEVYYDGESVVTVEELESRCEHLMVMDIEFVKSPHKDNI